MFISRTNWSGHTMLRKLRSFRVSKIVFHCGGLSSVLCQRGGARWTETGWGLTNSVLGCQFESIDQVGNRGMMAKPSSIMADSSLSSSFNSFRCTRKLVKSHSHQVTKTSTQVFPAASVFTETKTQRPLVVKHHFYFPQILKHITNHVCKCSHLLN